MRIVLASGLLLAALTGAAVAADKVQIGDKGIFPESLTSTADGTLIVGSVGTGQIYRAAPGAATADSWIAPVSEGPASVLGVYADETNGTLWACYSDLGLFAGQGGKGAILRGYDLASGTLKATVPLGDGTFCNDIATTADGTAYVADTAGSQVLRVAPGASAADVFVRNEALASVDGLSFAPDGSLILNGVSTNKLFRLAINADGSAGALTELTLSQPIKGPDGMRFGDDGVLYLAENGAGQVSAVTIEGDTATIKVLAADGWDMPVAVTRNGSTLWVLESKFSKMGGAEDPGAFYAYPVALQ
jgi:sugar lactone lactonase YvrE